MAHDAGALYLLGATTLVSVRFYGSRFFSLIQIDVEMRKFIRHLGVTHGLDLFFGEFDRQANALPGLRGAHQVVHKYRRAIHIKIVTMRRRACTPAE
jgi:hypothetical protein